MRDHESPSYRAAMVDSGRGHLLPDPHPGGGGDRNPLPWHKSFCNPCREKAGLLTLERNEHRCLEHRPEPEHCRGSAYYCDPASWGCDCPCAQCNAVRAL